MANALGFAVLALAAATLNWLWHLRRHPYGKCRWCGGTGQNPGSIRSRYGRCTHCTKGERVRAGARLVNRELRKKGGWK